MGDAGFFKGTSSEQDTRFKDKEKSLLKSINFPKELDHKVDMRKVELAVMRPWISDKIMELLGFEDEVVVEYVHGLLDDPTSPIVDPKKMQINLTGFLESKTGPFMSELWTLLLSAQQSPLKVPALFIEKKKEEMRKREEADEQAQAMNKRRQEEEEEKERRLAEVRGRERGQQGHQRERGQPADQRSRPRAEGYGSRTHFVPPRERDTGWGHRGAPRPADDPARDPPSTAQRDRSPSPARDGRRESHHQREPASRRPRSAPRSRSRSPAASRRSHRRRSPSPRTYPRSSHRRGSPNRAGRTDRRAKKPDARSSSSDSARSVSPPPRRRRRSPSPPPRRRHCEPSRSASPPRRRHREPSRSPSPPRRRHREPSRSPSPPRRRHREPSRSPSPPRHSRRRRSHERSISPARRRVSDQPADPKSSDRRRSSGRPSRRSRSPAAKRGRDKPELRDSDRARRASSPASEADRSREAEPAEGRRPEPLASPEPTGSSVRRTSSADSQSKAAPLDDDPARRMPPVISIKGRAAKPAPDDGDHRLPADAPDIAPPDQAAQTRSQKLTEVVKERLLREKVKASMALKHP